MGDVLSNDGKIEWKYHDVTCLVCPKQNVRGLVMADTNIDEPEAGVKREKKV